MISTLFRRWGAQGTPLHTERLRLVVITPELLEAEPQGRAALERELHARVPPDWPPEHWDAPVWAHIQAQYVAEPSTFGWHRYMLLGKHPQQLVGCVGGFPGTNGDVEIGYSVVSSAQRQGFGSEAATALTEWLLRKPGVRSVSAQAFETAPGSVKVMQHCGMTLVGPGDQAGTVRYRRLRAPAPERVGTV